MTEYIAKVTLSDAKGRVIAEPGQVVPIDVIQRSRWLIERGKVEPKEVTRGV